MATFEELTQRFTLVLVCYVIFSLSNIFTLLHLPFRLYKHLRHPRAAAAPPKVTITTHPDSPASAKDTVLLIHGFPDSGAMWSSQAAHLCAAGYRCLVVDLPGARGERVDVALSWDETAQLVYDALRAVHPGRVTVLAHDWGAAYALLLVRKYPDTFRRVILLDVGVIDKQEASAMAAMFAYQTLLAYFFCLGGPVATAAVRGFLACWKYSVRPLAEVTVDMCYPYVELVKTIVKVGGLVDTEGTVSTETKELMKKIPHLFLYGKKKGMMFHSDKFVEFVKRTPGGEVVSLPSGHWITEEIPEECNQLLSRWLEKTEKAGGGDCESKEPVLANGGGSKSEEPVLANSEGSKGEEAVAANGGE